MFMALTTTAINAAVVAFTPLLSSPDVKQAIMGACGIVSPFIAVKLLKFYIRADDPPDLVRKIAAIEAAIKTCKKHLADKNCSEEFKQQTRRRMEGFQSKLQTARSDYEQGRSHVITPIHDQVD